MSENEVKYHDTVLDLEAKAKENENVVLKVDRSLQGMFMLGPKPMSFYDPNLKHGLGYENPYTLKKAISQNLKLYDASCFDDTNIHVNIRDTEDILDDATNSQMKMENKLKDPIAIEKTKYVRAKNQDLLITISELKDKLKNVEKGLKVAFSVRGPSNRDSSFKNSALSNTMKSPERVEASDRINKKPNVASKNVILNKKIVIDADVKNALKVKDVL
ncbi:hypothetical protein Tco_0785474 [Tanacetum coccineum]